MLGLRIVRSEVLRAFVALGPGLRTRWGGGGEIRANSSYYYYSPHFYDVLGGRTEDTVWDCSWFRVDGGGHLGGLPVAW